MASAKIAKFLQNGRPGVLVVTGTSGSGKHYAISEAAQQAKTALVQHDLTEGAVHWSRLGANQLTSAGLQPTAHVVSNASADFLRDLAFVKTAQSKIILVADDACPRLRESGVPIVRIQPLSSDAMAKKLFLEMNWPAEEAVHVAKQARGDWHQVQAQRQLASHSAAVVELSSALDACSSKDEALANEPPCMTANRFLNGTAPPNCPLDSSTIAWVERNQAVHCDDLATLALRQEMLAISADGLLMGCPASEELFKRVACYPSKRVHYRSGLYASPWEKDTGAVLDISTSFKKQRMTFSDGLKARALLEDAASASDGCAELTRRARPKANPQKKAAAKDKSAASGAPRRKKKQA